MASWPFSNAEILDQVNRVCRNRLFSRSHNQQILLRYLVNLRLSGASEHHEYNHESLSVGAFKKTSSIGKVEALKLRKRLQSYYETDGHSDRVVLSIPQGSFRPEITHNPGEMAPLGDEAAIALWQGTRMLEHRTGTSYGNAMEHLYDALKLADGPHPRILSMLAFTHWSILEINGFKDSFTWVNNLIQVIEDQGVETWRYLYVKACMAAVVDWNWSEADRLFARAEALSGGHSRLGRSYWGFRASQRRVKALLDIQRMLFDQTYGDVLQQQIAIGELSLAQGRAEEAEQFLKFGLRMSPGHGDTSRKLAEVYEAMCQPDAAHKAICSIKEPPGFDNSIDRAVYWGLMGNKKPALRLLSTLKKESTRKRDARSRTLSGKYMVRLSIAAGLHDEAVEWLEHTVLTERDPYALWVNTDPILRHLYSHPKFQDLIVKRMGLSLPHD